MGFTPAHLVRRISQRRWRASRRVPSCFICRGMRQRARDSITHHGYLPTWSTTSANEVGVAESKEGWVCKWHEETQGGVARKESWSRRWCEWREIRRRDHIEAKDTSELSHANHSVTQPWHESKLNSNPRSVRSTKFLPTHWPETCTIHRYLDLSTHVTYLRHRPFDCDDDSLRSGDSILLSSHPPLFSYLQHGTQFPLPTHFSYIHTTAYPSLPDYILVCSPHLLPHFSNIDQILFHQTYSLYPNINVSTALSYPNQW